MEDDGGDRYFSLLVVIPPEVLETRDAEEVINAVETVLYGDERVRGPVPQHRSPT